MSSSFSSGSRSALEEYGTKILDGKIACCKKLKQITERLLDDLQNPGEYHFDIDIARRHVDFIERFCRTPSGKLGTPLKLELFQRARLEAIFGFVDDNDLRRFNEVLIIEGRKNGKTTETAAVELDLLVNDKEGSPQIYNVATKKDQANLGYTACVKMMRLSPLLSKHLRKRQTDIYNPLNMGFITALASNTNSLDGLDTHGATIDELAAIKNRDLYDLVKQSMGARSQPLLFTISTNGFLRNGIFDAQYEYASGVLDGTIDNPRFLPFIYELDSPEEWDDPACWEKANPGLGTIKKVEYLEEMVAKAKADPTFKPTVLVKDFNLRQTAESAWLRYEELNNEEHFDIRFKYAIGGFDAADTTDLNAAKAICMRPGDDRIYVRSMYWIPEEVIERNKATRRERDSAPYELWISQGLMRTCPGNRVDKKVFLDWYRELKAEGLYMTFIGYDPWHVDDTLLREFRGEFGQKSMISVRQGAITLSEPMGRLKADFEAHRVIYNDNPIDKWCLINTGVKTDVNGNIQPVKQRDPRQRIDGTAALLDAYVVLLNVKDKYIELNRGCE